LPPLKQEVLSIHQQLPTIGIDDMVNALEIAAAGKTQRAAEILKSLHRRHTTIRQNED
jgi:hypothetical protein